MRISIAVLALIASFSAFSYNNDDQIRDMQEQIREQQIQSQWDAQAEQKQRADEQAYENQFGMKNQWN